MKRQLWLASFACALSLAATHSQPLIAQNVIPDIRATQADGKAAKIIIFDAPGGPYKANSEVLGPTIDPAGIDAAGTVVGSYRDADNGALYGYYRLADGTLHRFHPDPMIRKDDVGAVPTGIAADGTIIGSFSDTGSYVGNHIGFIRAQTGYTEFNPFDSIDTLPQAINSAGVVTGEYEDASGNYHGFVRDAEGNFTSFDAPVSGTVLEIMPTSINSSGSIVGFVSTPTSFGGFLRDSNGMITLIDIPQSYGFVPVAISDSGLVVGWLNTGDTYAPTVGFILDSQGNYTTFSPPGAVETFPTAIDPQGSIVGYYADQFDNLRGFYRLRDGTFGIFSVPASTKTLPATWTLPTAISPKGDITGFFFYLEEDGGGYEHNFIRINPDPPPASAGQDKNATGPAR